MNSTNRQTQDSLLDSIRQAMDEKTRAGLASEDRLGFVARVANATPPPSETFQRTLWARILAKETERGESEMTNQDRTQPVHLWRFAWVTLAAVLVVVLGVTLGRTVPIEWNRAPVERSRSEGGLTNEDMDALAEAINGAPAPRTVIFYPDRGAPLAERVRYKTISLGVGEDTTPATIQKAVDAILPPNGYVDLVMAAAQENDTTHQVRAQVERTLFRLYRPSGEADTEVYGALERNTFFAGPVDAVPEPIGARFEGGVELVAGGALDEPQAGTPLRMAFDWRIQEPVSDSLVIFVHLVRGEFEVVAQRDAAPGNGLFPVEAWMPGELVRDQFALLLPPTLPAGEYELRVGIYDATTQMRHNLMEPGSGTYVLVQNWSLDGSGQADQQSRTEAKALLQDCDAL